MTGIKVVDLLAPYAKVEKLVSSAVLVSVRLWLSWNSSTISPMNHGGYSVFAGVGEHS